MPLHKGPQHLSYATGTTLTRQHAACASKSDSITLAGPVSPRNLNAACLRVKVESIKILTERPALNSDHALCLPPAIITQSDATVETWRWEHARESVCAWSGEWEGYEHTRHSTGFN